MEARHRGSLLRARRDAGVSSVPGAAVSARARDRDRPDRAHASSGHRPRALCRAARDGGVSCRSDSHRGRRSAAPDRDDAAWHRHHARRQRPVVHARRRVLDRAIACRHSGFRQPSLAHDRHAGNCASHPRDPELPGLRDLPPASGARARRAASRRRRRGRRHARVQFPPGQARWRGCRDLPADSGPIARS